MAKSEPCRVPICPALAGLRGVCAQHARADTAKALGAAGQACVACTRKIKDADFVLREMAPKGKKAKPGAPFGYRHVRCEPPSARPSKATMKESEKPLLAGLSE